MDRREPPSLSLPRRHSPRPAPVDRDAPPRIRQLRRQDEAPRGSGLAARLGTLALYLGVALASILVALATFLTIAAPTDIVREQIVAQVKTRTGRTLSLDGSTSLQLFPRLGVTLDNVTLSAPPDMQAAPLAKIKQINAEIRLSPLLRREVVIRRMVLTEPIVEFVIDERGRRTWDFAAGETAPPPARVQVAQAGVRGARTDGLPPELKDFVKNSSDPERAGQIGGLGAMQDLIFVDTRIENGTFRFVDLRDGTRREFQRLNVDVGLRSLQSPLEVKGGLTWQGEAMQVDARLFTLKQLIEGRPARLDAKLTGNSLTVSYDGNLIPRSAIELEGEISVSTPSLRRAAALAGTELPPAKAGFGAASLKAGIRTAGPQVSLEPAEIAVDGAVANGTLSFETGGVRPSIKANLRVSELDLNKYVRPEGSTLEARAAGVPPSVQQKQPVPLPSPGKASPPRSIEELLLRDGENGSRVRGFSQREGWSGDPYPIALLALADIEAKLSIGKLTAGHVRFGNSQVGLVLRSNQLRLTLDDAQLYEGRGRGFITVDATKVPVYGANLQLDGVATQPLLKDVADFDTLSGRGKLSIALAGTGQSEKDLVESLNGRVDLAVSDGAIVGWNFEQMVRNLGQGRFSGFDRADAERTPFSELAALFQIESGVATNKDLRIVSPMLRVTGAGTVELPARRLDFTVRPRLIAGDQTPSLQGQARAAEPRGFEIPIRVHGPWDRLSYAPDIGSVLKDPDKVVDTVKQIGRHLEENGTLDKAKRLFDKFLKP